MDYEIIKLYRVNRTINRYYIFLFYYLPFFMWMIAIWIGTSLPGKMMKIPDIHFGDKIIHFIVYMGLGFLFRRLVPFFKAAVWRRQANRLTLFWGLIFGALDELHQILIPGREATWSDFAADSIGIVAGILLFHVYKKAFKDTDFQWRKSATHRW